MRAEIRERLAEKVPLAVVAGPKIGVPLGKPDNRVWLKLTTPDGEAIMGVPESVVYTFRSRYGKAPGFEKWFMDRIREMLNCS